jgi:hypothetical protein
LGRFWYKIGTVLELTWESIYVKIIMLKTVIKNENGYGGALEGVPFLSPHSS